MMGETGWHQLVSRRGCVSRGKSIILNLLFSPFYQFREISGSSSIDFPRVITVVRLSRSPNFGNQLERIFTAYQKVAMSEI